jgi:hypothetical protein
MTSLTHDPPIFVSTPIPGTNDRWTHLYFIMSLIEAGAFEPGDYLVQDNAKIHVAADVRPFIDQLMGFLDIKVIQMPKYWPSLNPAELVQGRSKRYMVDERGHGGFVEEVYKGYAKVHCTMMENMYRKCLQEPLPD